MIKITIERTINETYAITENFETRREPTEIFDETNTNLYSSNRKERRYIIQSEPREVQKVRERKVTLLEQEIMDEASFNLKEVIATINGIRQ